jgi:hypothetical protein
MAYGVKNNKAMLYLFDFGMTKQIANEPTTPNLKQQEKIQFAGTIRF